MTGFISSIIDTITDLLDFFISTLTGFLSLIASFPKIITFITNSINTLPSFLKVFIIAALSIGIIQYIIGRQGK